MAAVAAMHPEVVLSSGPAAEHELASAKPCKQGAWGGVVAAAGPTSARKWPSLSESLSKAPNQKQRYSCSDESTSGGSSSSSDGHSDDESFCKAGRSSTSDRFGCLQAEEAKDADEGCLAPEDWGLDEDEFLFGAAPECSAPWHRLGVLWQKEPTLPAACWKEPEDPRPSLRTEAPVFVPGGSSMGVPPLGALSPPPGLRTPLFSKAAAFVPSTGLALPPGLENVAPATGQTWAATAAPFEIEAPPCAELEEDVDADDFEEL